MEDVPEEFSSVDFVVRVVLWSLLNHAYLAMITGTDLSSGRPERQVVEIARLSHGSAYRGGTECQTYTARVRASSVSVIRSGSSIRAGGPGCRWYRKFVVLEIAAQMADLPDSQTLKFGGAIIFLR